MRRLILAVLFWLIFVATVHAQVIVSGAGGAGATGPQGPQGAQGVQGPQGPRAVYFKAGATGGHTPGDNLTYRFADQSGFNPSTIEQGLEPTMAFAGTVSSVFCAFNVTGTLASGESVTVRVRNIDANTTENVSTSFTMNAATAKVNNTSMTLAFSAGDRLQIQFLSPAWATNPTAVIYNCTAVVQ